MEQSVRHTPRDADIADDHHVLARAVRATVHRQILDMLERRGVLNASGLVECPSCGDRIISLDQPGTFAFDPATRTQICAACSAERDFLRLATPDDDLGGEGGA